jgi:uncharacterized membrane protein YfhO
MGFREILSAMKERKNKEKEVEADLNLREKLANRKKSADEIFLEKHYEKQRQERLHAQAIKIQHHQAGAMISTKMPKYKNELKMNMKFCSDGIKI